MSYFPPSSSPSLPSSSLRSSGTNQRFQLQFKEKVREEEEEEEEEAREGRRWGWEIRDMSIAFHMLMWRRWAISGTGSSANATEKRGIVSSVGILEDSYDESGRYWVQSRLPSSPPTKTRLLQIAGFFEDRQDSCWMGTGHPPFFFFFFRIMFERVEGKEGLKDSQWFLRVIGRIFNIHLRSDIPLFQLWKGGSAGWEGFLRDSCYNAGHCLRFSRILPLLRRRSRLLRVRRDYR